MGYMLTHLSSAQHQLRLPGGKELPGECAVFQSALSKDLGQRYVRGVQLKGPKQGDLCNSGLSITYI